MWMKNVLSERVIVFSVLFLISVALFLTTQNSEYQTLGAVQSPVFFPRIILAMWAILAVIALIQSLFEEQRPSEIDKWLSLVIFVIVAVIYVNAVTRLGFMLSSTVFSVISLLIFGLRNLLGIALYAVLVPGTIVVLFNHILKLPLPTSPFTYLF